MPGRFFFAPRTTSDLAAWPSHGTRHARHALRELVLGLERCDADRMLIHHPLVLIAERDQTVRGLQRLFLERAGLAVEFADDGLAALDRARREPPAVLVTEILVPKLDGLTLCRRLRDEPATAHVPVLVFSILAAATRAAEAGARAFLRKPLVESIFVAAVLGAIANQPPATTEQQWASR